MLLIPDVIVEPVEAVYHGAISKPAQKAYIRTILATSLAVFLLIVASLAYSLFYLNYVPQIGFDTPVHMTYGYETMTPIEHKQKPWGVAAIPAGVLTHNQPYNVDVVLTVPTTKHNHQVGNFMVNVSLMDSDSIGPLIFKSARRQTRLTHMSDLVTTLDTLLWSPLYLSGMRREEEVLTVKMMEGVNFGKGSLPNFVALAIGNDEGGYPEAYTAQVKFKARFGGVRYLMYNYRILSFLLCTIIFWLTELFWAGLAWIIIGLMFGSSSSSSPSSLSARQTGSTSDEDEDIGALTPLSTAADTKIYPLAPADDDSEEIPRPRGVGIYATPEGTPAPEDEGDVEDEVDSEEGDLGVSNGLGSDEDAKPATTGAERYSGGTDSGIGSSWSESRGNRDGLVQRRRPSRS